MMMPFQVPLESFKNDTIYHWFGTEYCSNIFGCGFLNKKNQSCKEANIVFDHYGAVLVLSGKGIHIDDEGNETKVYPGCLIQRIPEKRQSLYIHPDGRWLEFFICINKSLYHSLVSMDLLDNKQNVLFPGLSHAIFDKFNEFFTSMKHAHPTELNMLIPEALKIIFMLYELHKENTNRYKDREMIHQACLLLSNSSFFGYSLKDISKDLGIGYEKFRKLFKNQMGISPGSYALQKRIDHAKTLLLEKNKSIKEISLELGFSDAYSFSKQFKQLVGLSPSEFRRIIRI